MLNEILDMSLENCVLFLRSDEKFDRAKYGRCLRLLSLIWKAEFLPACQHIEQYMFDQNQEGAF